MKTTLPFKTLSAAALLAAFLAGPALATEPPPAPADALCRPLASTDGATVQAICVEGALAALVAPAPDQLATAQPWRPRPAPQMCALAVEFYAPVRRLM